MPIRTKRWNDPIETDDGHRLLITRYRPRGVSKADETWQEWNPKLGPSKELLAAFRTSTSSPIGWSSYGVKYVQEQRANRELINALAGRSKDGEMITLLCSSSCDRESRCHRSILRELIETAEKSLP
jgi:uncharacterized protein YeaO (DUF488 family)